MTRPGFVRLGEVADITVGHVGRMASRYTSDGVPFLRSQNVKPHRIDLNGIKYIPWSFHSQLQKSALAPGDVVVVRTGEPGTAAVVPDSLTVANCADLVVVRPSSRVDPSFLSYHINGISAGFIASRLVGAVQRHFNVASAREIEVPDLPINMQRRAAEALEALDGKIAVNERIATTALELAEAEYAEQAAVSADWKSVALSDAARWLSGGTPQTGEPSYWGGEIPWISAVSLKSPWIDGSDRQVTRLGAENGTRLVPKGTIIFVVRGSSLDFEFRVGVAQREVAFGQDCKALIPANGVDPSLLFVAIRSKSAQILGLVDHAGHGAGRLATDRIAQLSVHLPPDDRLAALIRPLVALGGAMHHENRTLASLRDTLLPELISGRLRVKDTERQVEDAT